MPKKQKSNDNSHIVIREFIYEMEYIESLPT